MLCQRYIKAHHHMIFLFVSFCQMYSVAVSFDLKATQAPCTYSLSRFRASDVSSHPPAVHPRARALHLLHAGDRLLLPQWSGWTPPPHEGGDGGHPGGHHRPKCLGVSSLYIRQTAPAQVEQLRSFCRNQKHFKHQGPFVLVTRVQE